jgi:hypothetical protein
MANASKSDILRIQSSMQKGFDRTNDSITKLSDETFDSIKELHEKHNKCHDQKTQELYQVEKMATGQIATLEKDRIRPLETKATKLSLRQGILWGVVTFIGTGVAGLAFKFIYDWVKQG